MNIYIYNNTYIYYTDMILYTCICMNLRSRTRRTPCKLIERFPDQSQGQFRFNREDGYYLQASYFGVWW
jgi:hypothetical protein